MRKRSSEYFSKMLNRPSTVNSTALKQIPQLLHDLPHYSAKGNKAILQINSGKASGIAVEIYKTAIANDVYYFHDVLQSIWEEMQYDIRDD